MPLRSRIANETVKVSLSWFKLRVKTLRVKRSTDIFDSQWHISSNTRDEKASCEFVSIKLF